MAVRPEQIQLAFDNAVAHEIDGFETDVRLTKDHELVVFYDNDVDRTTNGSGKISEHTLAELKQLDAGYHFTDINAFNLIAAMKMQKFLTFDELLKTYPNQLISVNLQDDPKVNKVNLP